MRRIWVGKRTFLLIFILGDLLSHILDLKEQGLDGHGGTSTQFFDILLTESNANLGQYLIYNIILCTVKSIPVVNLSSDRVPRRIIMQLHYLRYIHRNQFRHQYSITKIPWDISNNKIIVYFLGLDKVKVSTQSYSSSSCCSVIWLFVIIMMFCYCYLLLFEL